MKNLFIGLMLLTSPTVMAQTLESVNARFTFYQGADTIDLAKPVIRANSASLSFHITSRREFKQVSYKVIAARDNQRIYELTGIATNSISWAAIYNTLRPNDRIVVEIVHLADAEGKKFRPVTNTFSFTLK